MCDEKAAASVALKARSLCSVGNRNARLYRVYQDRWLCYAHLRVVECNISSAFAAAHYSNIKRK